jgi:hypothetical protein
VPVAIGGRVNALDLGAVKRALNTSVGITSRIDINHDGKINALDLGAIKGNLNAVLPAFTAPTTPAAAAGSVFSNIVVAPQSTTLAPKRTGVWDALQA